MTNSDYKKIAELSKEYSYSKGFYDAARIITGVVLIGFFLIGDAYTSRHTPKTEKSYIDLNEVNFKRIDFNQNGETETVLVHRGIEYLLKEDEMGKPVVIPFEAHPGQSPSIIEKRDHELKAEKN